MRAVGGFLLAVGVAIAGLWAVQLTVGQVPEIDEGRIDIWFHIAAELATAGVLVAAGVVLLQRRRPARTLGGIAVGALAYTIIRALPRSRRPISGRRCARIPRSGQPRRAA